MTKKEIIQKANEYSKGNETLRDAFIAGYQFATYGKFYNQQSMFDDYPCLEALNTWLAYKREKKQTYKPMGLKALRGKLFNMSGGDPERAKEIVEYSMANNYSGLFQPKNIEYNDRRQQQLARKISEIMSNEA